MRMVTCHSERRHWALGLCRPCYDANYYAIHKEGKKTYQAQYAAVHKEERAAYDAAYRSVHREEHRANDIARYAAQKLEVMVHYCDGTPYCQWPGGCEYNVTNLRHLTIDHVDGRGNEHRRNIGGSSYIYRWLRRNGYPEGFRVLCFNHNCGNWRTKR